MLDDRDKEMGDTVFDVSHPSGLLPEGFSEVYLELITDEVTQTGLTVVH